MDLQNTGISWDILVNNLQNQSKKKIVINSKNKIMLL